MLSWLLVAHLCNTTKAPKSRWRDCVLRNGRESLRGNWYFIVTFNAMNCTAWKTERQGDEWRWDFLHCSHDLPRKTWHVAFDRKNVELKYSDSYHILPAPQTEQHEGLKNGSPTIARSHLPVWKRRRPFGTARCKTGNRHWQVRFPGVDVSSDLSKQDFRRRTPIVTLAGPTLQLGSFLPSLSVLWES